MTPTQQARADVLAADGGCVAPVVDGDGCGPCRDHNGVVRRPSYSGSDMVAYVGLEVDRVRDAPTMGKAPGHDDRTRMVALCPGHHRGVGAQAGYVWATAHRPDLRDYLARRNARLGWTRQGRGSLPADANH